MDMFNVFYLNVKKRIDARECDYDQKARILDRVIHSVEKTGVFKEVSVDDLDLDDDDWEVEQKADIEFAEPISREDLIRAKQQELGITEDAAPKVVIPSRWGRSRLHEAVLMEDVALIRKYIRAGDDAHDTDNNLNTPYDLAILHGNETLINLFEELKAAF